MAMSEEEQDARRAEKKQCNDRAYEKRMAKIAATSQEEKDAERTAKRAKIMAMSQEERDVMRARKSDIAKKKIGGRRKQRSRQ